MCMPVASKSAAVRCARFRQSATSPETKYGIPQIEKVRKLIGHEHRHVAFRVDLARTQRSADASVAAADRYQPHRELPAPARRGGVIDIADIERALCASRLAAVAVAGVVAVAAAVTAHGNQTSYR